MTIRTSDEYQHQQSDNPCHHGQTNQGNKPDLEEHLVKTHLLGGELSDGEDILTLGRED